MMLNLTTVQRWQASWTASPSSARCHRTGAGTILQLLGNGEIKQNDEAILSAIEAARCQQRKLEACLNIGAQAD